MDHKDFVIAVFVCCGLIAAVAVNVFAVRSERKARASYWATPTIAVVQRRYRIARRVSLATIALAIVIMAFAFGAHA
ncbi:hypothetical protein pEaSNUABM52_00067 [Erwinia phage pEp_SNUABM_52]|nr:hypothetical protein pEaSNUABM52_00067 [Erwinia phage pEp_SNUABM_52]